MPICRSRACALLPLLIVFCMGCSREAIQTLGYSLLQCGFNVGAIRQGQVCELPEQSQWVDQRIIRLDVPEFADNLKIEGGYLDSSKGQILQIRIPSKISKLVLRYPAHGPTLRIATIAIAPYEAAPALAQGIESWMTGNKTQAEQQLRQAISEGSPAMRSRAQRLLAEFLLGEVGDKPERLSEVLSHNEQAVRLARDSGEISDEAFNTLKQATLRQQYFRQSALAEQILSSPRLAQLSAQLPGLAPWVALHQGEVLASSDPYRALAAVEKGVVAVTPYKDDLAQEQLCRQRLKLLYTLGRVAEAQKPCGEGNSVNSCWEAYNMLAQARIQLMNMDVTYQKDADPRLQLDHVIRLLKSDCPSDDAKLSEANIYMATAKLLAGDYEKLSEQQMAAWPQPQDPELQAELLTVRGELALINSKPDTSKPEQIFRTLQKLAQEKGLHAYAWRALIGLARSNEQSAPKRALSLYQDALGLLEEWTEQLPIGLGHGSFIGRYEEGARRCVDFMLRQGESKLALEVVRRVRMLGMLALILTSQVKDLPEDKRTALLTARIDFEQARLHGNPATQAQMRSKLFEQISRILGQPRIFPLPPPAPLKLGEALFTCFPVFPEAHSDAADRDWACFATRDTAGPPVVARVGSLDPKRMHRSQLAQKLLKPFMSVLAPAQVIRVLEYGRFAGIPMHLLPLPDAADQKDHPLVQLGAQHAVVYALDLPAALLPPVESATAPPKAAFLIIDPSKEFTALSSCANSFEQAVSAFAGPPQLYQTGMPLPLLLEKLNRASFFLFSGHGRVPEDQVGYAHSLVLSGTDMLSASMLLGLHRAPDNAVLLGCGTGSTQDQFGDGITLGVAQALLVRGAREVIGTSHSVDAETGAAVQCQLHRHFSAKDKPYPFAAALQRTLQGSEIEALGPIEQEAFRSYVY